MGLRMSPRIPIQKITPPSSFPPHRPRGTKIKAKGLPTIHEEGSWGNPSSPKKHSLLLQALGLRRNNLSCLLLPLRQQQALLALIICCPPLPIQLEAACSPSLQFLAQLPQGFISASLVSQVAAGAVRSCGRRVIRGSATAFPARPGRSPRLYIEAMPSALHLYLRSATEALFIL